MSSSVCVRCFGEDSCLSIPDVRALVMVLPPSEPRITITGSNRLVRPASDLRGPLGVTPFKELHITSTVMKGDGFSGGEWRRRVFVNVEERSSNSRIPRKVPHRTLLPTVLQGLLRTSSLFQRMLQDSFLPFCWLYFMTLADVCAYCHAA